MMAKLGISEEDYEHYLELECIVNGTLNQATESEGHDRLHRKAL